MAENNNSPEITPSPFEFKESPKAILCSSLTCPSGHIWPIEAQITHCPGCKSPILAIKMVNCPQCNEPSASLLVRSDHLSRGQAITAICQGAATLADIHKIEIKLNHAEIEQQNHKIRLLPEKL